MRLIINNGYYMNMAHSLWVYFVHDATPLIWVFFKTPYSHISVRICRAPPGLPPLIVLVSMILVTPTATPTTPPPPLLYLPTMIADISCTLVVLLITFYRCIHRHPEGICTMIILFRYATNVVDMKELFKTKSIFYEVQLYKHECGFSCPI